MTAAEMTEWAAYERIAGPLVVHERIDVGFAALAAILIRIFTGKSVDVQRLLPEWDQEARAADPDSVMRGFQKLVEMAERK